MLEIPKSLETPDGSTANAFFEVWQFQTCFSPRRKLHIEKTCFFFFFQEWLLIFTLCFIPFAGRSKKGSQGSFWRSEYGPTGTFEDTGGPFRAGRCVVCICLAKKTRRCRLRTCQRLPSSQLRAVPVRKRTILHAKYLKTLWVRYILCCGFGVMEQ